jgi:hypothetical protein
MTKGGWKGKTQLKQLKITPDENLAKIVGDKPLSTSQLINKLWIYMAGQKVDGKRIGGNCKIEKIKT